MDLSGLLPTIEQAPGFRDLREGLSAPSARQLAGLPDSAKPAALAALLSAESGPALIVTGRASRTQLLVEELAAWFGEGRRVLLFPERDVLPFERLSPDPQTVRERLAVLSALNAGERCVIVASAHAVAQRTLAPGEVRGAILALHKGQTMDMEDLIVELDRLGYVSSPIVEQSGEFSRRGGIVDIFPPTAADPLRIEFFGDEIESLRHFSTATQRTIETVDEVLIGTSQEIALASAQPALELLARLNYKQVSEETRQRFEEDVAYLQSDLAFPNRDFYVPFLAPATLLDHLPAGGLLVIDEEADLQAAVDEAQEDVATSRAELEATGEIPSGLPQPIENWTSLYERIEKAPRVLTLARWAMEGETSVVRPPFTAAPAYGGQIRKLVDEAIAGLGAGQPHGDRLAAGGPPRGAVRRAGAARRRTGAAAGGPAAALARPGLAGRRLAARGRRRT